MTTQISPAAIFQSFLPTGGFNAGGKVFTYAGGTTTPQATFTDNTGAVQNTNPIILNSMGQAQIWLTANLVYKYVVQDQFGNALYTTDQINGAITVPNLVVGPPATGTALTVNNALGFDAIDVNMNQAAGAGFVLSATGSSTTSVRGVSVRNSLVGGIGNAVGMFIGNDTINSFNFGKQSTGNTGAQFVNGVAGDVSWIQSGGLVPIELVVGSPANVIMSISQDGLLRGIVTIFGNLTVGNIVSSGNYIGVGASFSGAIGINAATPPAQITGWGVPTGGAVVANFPGAGPATLAQCSTAISEIIFALKQLGLFGA